MSEVFDPEKVERWLDSRYDPPRKAVRASDYDKLLALYREQARLLVWLKHQVEPGIYETLAMTAKAEIRVAYECGDL